MAVREGLERQARGTRRRVSYARELIRGVAQGQVQSCLRARLKSRNHPDPCLGKATKRGEPPD